LGADVSIVTVTGAAPFQAKKRAGGQAAGALDQESTRGVA
jgi:hypothetical protein